MKAQLKYISLALLAALLYAISTPFSKALLVHIPSTLMASFLYFGAGIGVGALWLMRPDKQELRKTNLTKADLPYTLGMIVLDIAAPILLMAGLSMATAANVSLLNNFEIVATTVIASMVFRERISKPMWLAIGLITLASLLLSFEDASSLQFSYGSLFVIGACLCWGLENNCTRAISDRNVYEIVTLKGMCSGLGSLIVGLAIGETIPAFAYVAAALLLGFVAYGLSIFVYIKAQSGLGAAKTSAYYAVAPFIGAGLSLAILHESVDALFVVALLVMLAGTVLVSADAMFVIHRHTHTHLVTETTDGKTRERAVSHAHYHVHPIDDTTKHNHHHIGLHGI